MLKIDRMLLGETVKGMTNDIKAYLSPDLRPCLDDLIQLHLEWREITAHPKTKEHSEEFKTSFSNLCNYLKSHPTTQINMGG